MCSRTPARRALWERLQFTLDGEPDPWHEMSKARIDRGSSRRWAVMSALAANTEPLTAVCTLADIPVLGARVVARPGHPDGDVAMFRTADDRVFAVLDRCPHKGGPLSQGIVFGDRVACPLHNWSIELASGEAVAPDVGWHAALRR